MASSLYIHIPFCVRKCNYCAFLSVASNAELRRDYAGALINEIRLRAAVADGYTCRGKGQPEPVRRSVIDTVYFGGGTPSVMETELIAAIMDAVRDSFELRQDAEITIEANPGTLGSDEPAVLARLQAYRAMGFNRLSMGVQSMDDGRLAFLGRIHSSDEVRRDVRLARQAGFDNINLDLIFSVPGESGDDAIRDAEAIIELGPEHISCYSLQLEEGTAFYRMAESGEISEVSDEEDRETYHRICGLLRGAGYEHYEISNFARMPDGSGPGFAEAGQVPAAAAAWSPYRSRHNSLYWDMSDYIGVGLGASGFVSGVRYRNMTDIDTYIKTFSVPGPDCEEETHANTAFDNISEAVFTGLRRREGITYREALEAYHKTADSLLEGRLEETCNSDMDLFWQIFADAREEAEQYADRGLLIIDDKGMRLTERGIDISNGIMSLFV